jgi:prepilin-type N-terminal cleavage/methylation domain-containing protein
MIKTANKGFTLIELLVVIAIIGLLSTIVVASLSTVRKKARDTKRVADVKSLQLALELYFDANRQYAYSLAALAPTYIPSIPTDPLTGTYSYSPLNAGCTGYHLGATLEDITNTALRSDTDAAPGTIGSACSDTVVGTGGGVAGIFDGTSAGTSPTVCSGTAGTAQTDGTQTETCYDITN